MKQLIVILLVYAAIVFLFAGIVTRIMRRRLGPSVSKLVFAIFCILGFLLAPIPHEGDFTFVFLRLLEIYRTPGVSGPS